MFPDNAAEFKSERMKNLFRNHLVKQRFTTPFVPEENGRIERQIRTVVESARAMSAAAKLPKFLWAEATTAAGHIRNRVPLQRLAWKTPYELWHRSKPSVKHLRIWGSVGYVFLEDHKRDKSDAKSERRILVGYDEKSRSYRMWLPDTNSVKISRDVRFVELIPKQILEKQNDGDSNGMSSTRRQSYAVTEGSAKLQEEEANEANAMSGEALQYIYASVAAIEVWSEFFSE